MLKNKTYQILLLIFILLALIIFLFTSGFIRGFAGDIIIICILYLLLRIFTGLASGICIASVLIFALGIELLQILKLPQKAGIADWVIIRLSLGATFDPLDLAAYGVGAILIYFLDNYFTRH